MISRLKSSVFCSVLFVAVNLPSAADVLVLASTDPSVTRGQILGEGETVTLAEGAHMVLLFEDGREEIIVGPVQFTHDPNIDDGSTSGTGLLGGIAEILTRLDSETRLGGVRSTTCETIQSDQHWGDIMSAWSDGCQATAAEAVSLRLANLETLEE
ncbi:MAG: hypothetical protein QNI84_01960 [Henriciella sp.]|nr:hypothetical protein [Henriciella sp.]